jgi:hypothetical protein
VSETAWLQMHTPVNAGFISAGFLLLRKSLTVSHLAHVSKTKIAK